MGKQALPSPRGSRALAAAVLLVLAVVAQADWAAFTPAELAERSALIVTGTLTEQRRDERSGRTIGVIAVDEVLKGEDGRSRVLIALPDPDALVVRSIDVHHPVGQHGLWYLRAADGLYHADRPDRFVPAGRADERIERLRASRAARAR